MKRLRNTSGLSDALVDHVCRSIAATLGIDGFDVECRKKSWGRLAGRAYTRGSAYHSNARPFVVLRIGPAKSFPCAIQPYQYGQHKGRKIVLANRTEALIYLAAHEIRHLFQARYRWPRTFGSKGRFSEVDTEAFAIRTLREWRAKQ